MSVFTSGVDTGNIGATTDLVKKSFAGMITRLMPNGSAPLFGMTSMIGSETALAVEHGFFTKTMLFPQATVNAGTLTSGTTTITVADSSNIIPGMILQHATTRENILVTAVPTATTLTVVRGVGTVAAASFLDATNWYQVGTAFEEGSARPQAVNVTPVRITNLTQIFRNTWALSGSAQATEVIAGDTPIAENRQDCAAFHAADIEKALFFGQKSQGTRNGQPFRTMDGLISIVSNLAYYPPSYAVPNVFTALSTTNYTQLEAMLDPVFNQTTDPKVANERILFVGGDAKKVVNNIGRLNGTYMMVDGQTNWGLQFSTFKTTRGTFRVVEHPLFNSNPSWSKMAIAVDLSTFSLAYLGNRKTQLKEFNVEGGTAQDNGIDAVGGTLTTELTTEIRNPPANTVIYGLTAAAAG